MHAAVAKTCDWGVVSLSDFIREKIEFPSCPLWDEVLATETSDPAIANGTDCGADCDVDPVRSIIEVRVFLDPFSGDPKLGDPL